MGHLASYPVQTTKDWRWTKNFNIQLHPDELDSLPFEIGDYAVVKNPDNPLSPGVYGRIDDGEHLSTDEIGIGMGLRYGIGVSTGDEIQLHTKSPSSKPLHRRFFDGLLRYRPAIGRVRYAVIPDIGYEVCRIDPELFDVLGIEPGDKIVIQSEHDRDRLKAFPIEGNIRARKRSQKADNPDLYPDCSDLLDTESVADTSIDHPKIYLDKERREKVGLDETENGGLCQPVILYRDSRAFFFRKLNDVAVTLILGILGFSVVFRDIVPMPYLLTLVLLAVGIVIYSIYYQVRYESLD